MGALAPVGKASRGIKTLTKKKVGVSEASFKDLRKALYEEREKSKDYLNRLMYLQAELENYRKRMEKRINESILFGNERLITNLLSVIDELELAIQAGKKTKKRRPLIEGVEMALKNMLTILRREGLTEIDAVGRPFDPNRHNAVCKVPTDKYAEGTVIEEVRKGFMFRGKVIRPSMVKIATALPSYHRSKSERREAHEV